MARVDCFVREDGTVLVNELNTIPGFTAIRSGDRAASSRPSAPGSVLSPSGSLAALREAGYPHTAIIGRILPQGDALEPIVLVE